MNQLRAPDGYRFKPSDEVIIKYYLIPKIEGKPLPSDHIYETTELYGKEAQALEKTFHQGKEWYKLRASYDEKFDDSLYFFTRLKKKWDNGNRISRIAGGGTWTEDNKGKVINTDSSYEIRKTPFSFTDNAVKGSRKRKMTTLSSDGNSFTWNMDEYSILKGEQVLDYVIVKIRRKLNKKEISSSTSSNQPSLSNQVTDKAVDFAVKGGKDDFGVHGRVPELPSPAKVSRMQYQLPIGHCYVVAAAEDSHLKYQPSSSAATVESISSSSVSQDVVSSTQQPMQSFGYPIYYGFPGYQVLPLVAGTFYPFPSGHQHKTAVPPRITDDQHEQKNSDNTSAQNHNNQEGC